MYRVIEFQLRVAMKLGKSPLFALQGISNDVVKRGTYPYVTITSNSLKDDGSVNDQQKKALLQGVQGPIPKREEMDVGKIKEILQNIPMNEEQYSDIQGIQGEQDENDLAKFTAAENLMSLSSHMNRYIPEPSMPSDDPELCSYTTGEASDLSSVMRSNVPEPYGRNPPSINMPRGSVSQHQKYISGNMIDVMHPNRKFHTSTWVKSLEHERPCPQGIQGSADEDIETFELWLKNCREYHLGDCDQQMKDVQTGRKTLSQIFDEQDELIRKVAQEYGNQTIDLNFSRSIDDGSVQGVQGPIKERLVEKIQDLLDNPSPQGIQGDDCIRFKLWLQNCARYGLANCDDQLQGVQMGRKTLSQIFDEQDEIIRKVAQEYVAPVASDNAPKVSVRHYCKSSESVEPPKLSQTEKLKRAVKEYGATVIVFHVGISLVSLGGFYVAVSSGLDVVGMLKSFNVGESVLESRLVTGASTFVMAYAVHKVFAPVRIAITLAATPFIVRYLRRIGFLKLPKQK